MGLSLPRVALFFLLVLLGSFPALAADLVSVKKVPVLHQAHPSDPIDPENPQDIQASVLYAQTFEKLITSGSYTAASALAPLKEVFSASARLSEESFLAAWRKWRFHDLLQQWIVDEDGRGLWKTQDSSIDQSDQGTGLGLTLGIRRQPDGNWWVILLRTRDDPGANPWPCSPTCQLVIHSDSRRYTLTARPPLGYDFRASDVVGAPLPQVLVSNKEDTVWDILPPGEKDVPVQFDVSWLRSVCQEKLNTCP